MSKTIASHAVSLRVNRQNLWMVDDAGDEVAFKRFEKLWGHRFVHRFEDGGIAFALVAMTEDEIDNVLLPTSLNAGRVADDIGSCDGDGYVPGVTKGTREDGYVQVVDASNGEELLVIYDTASPSPFFLHWLNSPAEPASPRPSPPSA